MVRGVKHDRSPNGPSLRIEILNVANLRNLNYCTPIATHTFGTRSPLRRQRLSLIITDTR